jgi:hypothetical protein
MKKIVISGFFTIIISFFCVQAALSADARVVLDFNSAYIWRGITFNDGMVIQPSVDVSKKGFGINVWGNIDISNYDDMLDTGQFSEVDLTLSYGFDIESVEITLGYIEYMFPTTDMGGALGTREFFVSIGVEIIEGFSTGLDIYYDFDEVEDYYANLSLAYSIPLSKAVNLDFGVSAGYAGDEYTADGDSGFFDYLISVGASYAVTQSLSLSASINYADAFDKDKLPDGAFAQDVNTFGGISISYSY